MTVQVVLFDADGVLQRTPPAFLTGLRALAPPNRQAAFVHDVFAREAPCLRGAADFPAALAEVLARWRCKTSAADALALWNLIEVNPDVAATVRALRGAGVRCCLASNQQAYRAGIMSEQLGYAAMFEQEFYSFRIGHCKPDAAFFEFVIDALACPAETLLLLDDRPDNVEAARRCGLNAAVFDARTTHAQTLHEILAGYAIGPRS